MWFRGGESQRGNRNPDTGYSAKAQRTGDPTDSLFKKGEGEKPPSRHKTKTRKPEPTRPYMDPLNKEAIDKTEHNSSSALRQQSSLTFFANPFSCKKVLIV